MRDWPKAVLAAGGGIVAAAGAAVTVGGLLWKRRTASTVQRLLSAASASHAGAFSRAQLEGLPEPVARYFEFALTPGQPLIQSARLEHNGEMRIGGFDSPWLPFSSAQHISADPPGFVWDASVRMTPFLTVRVRECYLGGVASMHARLAALIPVVDQRGDPRLAAGALHRYLAEAPWFPTALLPGHALTWEAIDSTKACATLTDGETTVSLEFQFAENGAIERTYTPARYREVSGAYVPTPWAAAYRSYAPTDGMKVPMEGEVEWILPEGRLPVWRGRLRRSEYKLGRSL